MKKVLAALLILAMMLCFFACDGAEKETQAPETTQAITELGSESVEEPTTAVEETTIEEITSGATSAEETPAAETTAEETPVAETTVEETSENESETETMEQKNTASVGIYEKYDLDVYMSPIWDGMIVHNETVMFVGMDDKVPLLYTPEKIISLRSYDLKTEYEEGVDYALEDGKLVLLEGTRIPYCPTDTYYSVHDNKPFLSTMYNGKVTQTMFGEGNAMCKWQFAVTYKHTGEWNGPVLDSYEDRYAGFIEKLEKGEDVTVFFLGDSITTGANSSSSVGVEPYAPSWPIMFTQYVAKQYGYTVKYVDSYSDERLTMGKPSGGVAREDTVFGRKGTITYINTAVGGWPTQHGLTYHDTYVKNYIEEYGCDLFVLAFGMNNGSNQPNEICNWLKQIVDKTVACAPETDVVLVSTMIPNPEAVRNPADEYFCNGNQSTFEPEMLKLAESLNNKLGVDCALAKMTSLSRYIHSQKRFRDTTGNNVNHPSDFVVRAYAQSIFQTVFGFENFEEEPIELDDTLLTGVNYNAVVKTPSGNTYLDGTSNTSNANNAVCVRIEAEGEGFFLYHIADGAKIYVNVNADNSIEYNTEARTAWIYDPALGSILRSGNTELYLTAPEICIHGVLDGEDTHRRLSCLRCGVKAKAEDHSFAEAEVEDENGSVTKSTVCYICGHKK